MPRPIQWTIRTVASKSNPNAEPLKGTVTKIGDIIKKFGTLENALAHADEVERKTYRESLLNNKDTILWSKQLVTIDQNVAIEFDVDKMMAGEPDTEALRSLFTELEFTTLLKELVPTLELKDTDYRDLQQKDFTVLRKARPLAVAFELTAAATVSKEEEAELERESGNLPLIPPSLAAGPVVAPLKLALSPATGQAFTAHVTEDELSADIKQLLQDTKVLKTVHDYKAALRELVERRESWSREA